MITSPHKLENKQHLPHEIYYVEFVKKEKFLAYNTTTSAQAVKSAYYTITKLHKGYVDRGKFIMAVVIQSIVTRAFEHDNRRLSMHYL